MNGTNMTIKTRLTLANVPLEFVESETILPSMNDPQKQGSAITYFRRYALQSLLALEAEDDDANLAVGHSQSAYKPRGEAQTQKTTPSTPKIVSGPLCHCGEPAKLLAVKKAGPNMGREFYACPKPKASQCDFFEWSKNIDEPLNIEGDKYLDYDRETGALLP
jgi:hypothetical protein